MIEDHNKSDEQWHQRFDVFLRDIKDQTTVANGPSGRLAFAYEGATVAGGPQRVYVRTSTDQGRSWSDRVALSAPGENATGPRMPSVAQVAAINAPNARAGWPSLSMSAFRRCCGNVEHSQPT